MTALAFILGVFFGMIGNTALGLLFTPVLLVTFRGLSEKLERRNSDGQAPTRVLGYARSRPVCPRGGDLQMLRISILALAALACGPGLAQVSLYGSPTPPPYAGILDSG